MPRNLKTRVPSLRAIWALVRLEWRMLAQNRMACVILLLLMVAAAALKVGHLHARPAEPNTCYVVYWRMNDWIRELELAARLARSEGRLEIQVVPVSQMAGRDGTIRYPRGSHSIQLRPLEDPGGERRGWLVWYWYSGQNPTAFLPYVEWFQRMTLEHFHEGLQWEERFSPMHTDLLAFGNPWRLELESFISPGRSEVALVWLVLFFVGCHLPKLSLAQAINGRMIQTIAATPVGWQGAAIGVRLFHGFLALALAVTSTAILQGTLLFASLFWFTMVCAIFIYLGVAVSIASWTGSVASAGLATFVYLAGSAALFAISMPVPFIPADVNWPPASPEAAILLSLDGIWMHRQPAVSRAGAASLLLWATFWQLVGRWSGRRLKRA